MLLLLRAMLLLRAVLLRAVARRIAPHIGPGAVLAPV
jgi:hypothetical protein